MFKSIKAPVTTIMEVEKSKFICNLVAVHHKDEAENMLNAFRQEHNNATHNCYAYYINEGQIQKFSDDGEPSRTGGFPILQAIIHQNLNNVLCVVTRYYGGIKLGTGGLIRAYGGSALKTIQQAQTTTYVQGIKAIITTAYNLNNQVEYILQQNKANIIDKQYLDIVSYSIIIQSHKQESLMEQLHALHAEHISIEIVSDAYYELQEGDSA